MSSVLPRVWMPRDQHQRFAVVPIERVRPVDHAAEARAAAQAAARAEELRQFDAAAQRLDRQGGSIHLAIRATRLLTQITEEQMLGPSREPVTVKARQMTCWLALAVCGHSLARVGRVLNRDHSSAHHGKERVRGVFAHYGRAERAEGLGPTLTWLWSEDWPQLKISRPPIEIPGVFPWHVDDRG